ncbi:hypothetical protein ACWFMI_13405 [Nocardiopsis terrae]
MDPLHPHDPPSVGPFLLLGRLTEDPDVRRYLARAEDGSEVTLAVARPNRATAPDFRAAFARRIEAVRVADSAHLCPVVAAEPHGAVPWAAAARPTGDSLDELLERHGDTVRAALVPLVRGLAQGLADLHAAGAAYGPFGAADVCPTGGGMGFAGPVPAADADGPAGAARDVHAWAELVTALAGTEGVPLRLRQLVEVCLHPDPGLRPSAADLVRMLGGTGVGTPPVQETREGAQQAPEEAPAPAGRTPVRRWLPLLAGGLVLAAVATTGTVLLRDRAGGADDVPRDGAEAGSDVGAEADVDCLDATAFPLEEEIPDDLSVAYGAFSPDGDVLAVQGFQHGISLWDWREGVPVGFVAPAPEHERTPPLFTPQGCGIVAPVFYDLDTMDRTVVTYDLVTGAETDHVERPEDGGIPASDPPDADLVAVAPDGTLALSMRSGETRVVPAGGTEPVNTVETGLAHDLAFLDEDRLAVLGGTAITVWDTGSGEELHKVEPTSEYHFAAGPGDDEVVHVHQDRVILWDFAERAEVASFTLPEYPGGFESYIVDLTVDADRDRVFVSWQEEVEPGEYERHNHVWDLATGEDVLPDGLDYYRAVPHPNGEVIAVVTADDGLDLLDPDTFEVVDTIVG